MVIRKKQKLITLKDISVGQMYCVNTKLDQYFILIKNIIHRAGLPSLVCLYSNNNIKIPSILSDDTFIGFVNKYCYKLVK